MFTATTDTRGDSLWVNLDLVYRQTRGALLRQGPHGRFPLSARSAEDMLYWNMIVRGGLDTSDPWSFDVSAEVDAEYQSLPIYGSTILAEVRERLLPGRYWPQAFLGQAKLHWYRHAGV